MRNRSDYSLLEMSDQLQRRKFGIHQNYLLNHRLGDGNFPSLCINNGGSVKVGPRVATIRWR